MSGVSTAEAEPLYRRVLAILEKALGPEHRKVTTCLENYAMLLREMDRPEDAEPLESRVRAIRAKSGPDKYPGLQGRRRFGFGIFGIRSYTCQSRI